MCFCWGVLTGGLERGRMRKSFPGEPEGFKREKMKCCLASGGCKVRAYVHSYFYGRRICL